MSMSMNIHGVCGVLLGEIIGSNYASGEPYYHREIKFIDKNGDSLLSISLFSDNGYSLLVDDKEIDSLQSDDLLKAA